MRGLYFIIQNLLAIMFVWCVFATSCARPGRVPPFYGHFDQKEIDNVEQDDELNPKFCTICNTLKPSRAHHCSKCKMCVLAFDHHCYMLGNCVGYYNKKSFILTVSYGVIIVFLSVLYNIFWMGEAFSKDNLGFMEM